MVLQDFSDYSGELLAALDGLTNWPEKVRLMQANWIGKSRGLQFAFSTVGAPDGFDRIEVYTTRPDTLMGASFAAISPDHPLAKHLERHDPEDRRVCGRMPQGWHHGRSHGNRRKARLGYRRAGAASV